MTNVVLRYGALLALFIISLDLAQRSYISRFMSQEYYILIVAIAFLCLGGFLGFRFLGSKTNETRNELNIIDKADFSDREAEILLFLSHGFTNQEIAEQLLITTNTVKTHLKNIYAKLGVSNRTQAAAEAKMLNIIG